MAQKYLLPCPVCGKSIPVETVQAGHEIRCECGNNFVVPSLLKIKKLPFAETDTEQSAKKSKTGPTSKTGQKVDSATSAPIQSATTNERSRLVWSIRLLGTFCLLVSTAWFVYCLLYTYPKPDDVLKRRVVYAYSFEGNDSIQRDSTPLTVKEEEFFSIPEERIDWFTPIETIHYWQLFKDGPAMSSNFWENYYTLIEFYYIRVVGSGLLIVLSIGIICIPFFWSNKSVGVRKGTEWK
ncbi:MAG: hypothetical protein ACRC10_11160 [Thermoguttaceae bacterium]